MRPQLPPRRLRGRRRPSRCCSGTSFGRAPWVSSTDGDAGVSERRGAGLAGDDVGCKFRGRGVLASAGLNLSTVARRLPNRRTTGVDGGILLFLRQGGVRSVGRVSSTR